MNLSGYLNDPYKVVPMGPPRHPDHARGAPGQSVPARRRGQVQPCFLWGASVNVLYRFYNDNWSIVANTLDVTYNQKFGADWIVSPELRFCTQTGA